MSTITTINAGDNITDSRAVINTNFSNLNTDKIETSYLDTDTTLAANSDAKIATQKAVKAYVDAGGNVNASTTGKGIVEEATQAEVDAGTAAGGTSARLFVNPSTLPVALTVVPYPVPFIANATATNLAIVGDTTANVALVYVPYRIVVNKLSFRTNTVSVAGTVDITMYSEDGQTQLFSLTSASLASTTAYTISVSSVALAPGNYWLMTNANSTTDAQILAWTHGGAFNGSSTLLDISSEPVLSGTLTITAGTPPATITPSSITAAISKSIIVRLDN